MPGPLDWFELFGRRAPVELEIGCGNGRFVAREAAARPETDFLAVDRARPYASLAARRLAKAALANARAGCAEAEDLLERLVAPASLDAAHIYFSDPWPKRRHAKRRLFQWPFLGLLARALKPGAIARVKTDVDWYFADIAALFAEHGAFDLVEFGEQRDFPEDETAMTGFESKAAVKRGRVFFLAARRKGKAAE